MNEITQELVRRGDGVYTQGFAMVRPHQFAEFVHQVSTEYLGVHGEEALIEFFNSIPLVFNENKVERPRLYEDVFRGIKYSELRREKDELVTDFTITIKSSFTDL